MCRIFGFRSIKDSGVHQSLVTAENALAKQSEEHADGWGVAHYVKGVPHVVKLSEKAMDCSVFKQVSHGVSAKALLAHIRLSTVGAIGPLNTHPFQLGPWVFCHNGTLRNFSKVRERFLHKIEESWRGLVMGETDSEVVFLYLMTLLAKAHDLNHFEGTQEGIAQVISDFVSGVESVTGPLADEQRNGDRDKNYLTFVLTNGEFMLGFNGGKSLLWSTYKRSCPEAKRCAYYRSTCEKLPQVGETVQHFQLSSEELHSENIWHPIPFKGFSFVDKKMDFYQGQVP